MFQIQYIFQDRFSGIFEFSVISKTCWNLSTLFNFRVDWRGMESTKPTNSDFPELTVFTIKFETLDPSCAHLRCFSVLELQIRIHMLNIEIEFGNLG